MSSRCAVRLRNGTWVSSERADDAHGVSEALQPTGAARRQATHVQPGKHVAERLPQRDHDEGNEAQLQLGDGVGRLQVGHEAGNRQSVALLTLRLRAELLHDAFAPLL